MREIPLNCKKFPELVTQVDDEDYEPILATGKVYAIVLDPAGRPRYATLERPDRSRTCLHNFICELHGLPLSPDHRDRDGFNNQKANFRPANGAQQNGNRGLPRNNTSGFKGVKQRPSGRWEAAATLAAGYVYLGLHDTREDAGRAYNKWALDYFGEYAALNCVNGVPL